MAKKRIQTLLPFALIAIVIAITLVFALRTPSARSEESTYEPGPYGTPENQIDTSDPWGFNKTAPTVRLKDLPPLPPPFGSGKRLKADGTVQTTGSIQDLSPELQRKIAELKAVPAPWDKSSEEGN